MAGTLIIGYGNPLRGDDGLGWHAAARLEEALRGRGVRILKHHQLLPELAEPVSEADRVIFVDAAVGENPGEMEEQAVLPGRQGSSFSHEFDPPGLLRFAEKIYGRCPEATMFTVTGARFGYEEGLSPAVEKALPELIRSVCHSIVEDT